MSVHQLKEILKPPSSPCNNGLEQNWKDVHKEIGTRLPDDYQHFINGYGSGLIGRFLYIWNPFSDNKYTNLIYMYKETTILYQNLKSSQPDDFPFNIYPENGGLLPFGNSINGDNLFWLTTKSDPNLWSLIIHQARSSYYDIHSYSLSDFLIRLMRKELQTSQFIYEASINLSKGFEKLEEDI